MPGPGAGSRATFWSGPGSSDTAASDPDSAGLGLLAAELRDHEYPLHSHEELVVAVTEAGGADYVGRGVGARAAPGRVMVFNPYEPHASRVREGQSWRYRAFYLPGAGLDRLAEACEVRSFGSRRFEGCDIGDGELWRALVEAHRGLEPDEGALFGECALLSAVALLYERHARPAPSFREAGSEPRGARLAREYIRAHHAEDVRVGALAALAGMSEFHFIRAFRRAVGMPPHAYLNQVRIWEARRLLRRGLPPAEVAAAVGYCDQSHLSRNFKRALGITPGQYARAVLG